jgi:quercetin 2,3-dioxygenase
MKTVFHPASERGDNDFGWLYARHSFSFGQWYNADKVHFGALRVLNDDIVQGGGGFPTHPHDNMEIVTIPLIGALAHKDSSGGDGIIKSGDVQIMSAGTGIRHSEFNASANEAVNLLQLWVFPKQKNIKPRYDQRNFDIADRKNTWQMVVSPNENDNALWINQDARFALSHITAGSAIDYKTMFEGNGMYIFVIEGSVEAEGNVVNKRDAIGVWETGSVTIKASTNADVLVVEVPMHFS